MKRFLSLLFFSLMVFSLSAHVAMKDVFRDMPDSLLPYITKNNRLDCIDFIESKMKAEVKNAFDNKSELLKLTDNYLLLKLSESSTLEMKLLPSDTTEIICMVTTFLAPEAESKVEFFSSDWKQLPTNNYYTAPSAETFWFKPDTITTERFKELKKYISPVMVEARLSESDNTLTLTLSRPLLDKDDKKMLDAVLAPVKFNWVAGKWSRY